jgi:hypothetical protein
MTSPALSLAIEAMFGNIKPTLTAIKKLGVTDFSAEKPSFNIKAGATIKVPVSSISAAAEFNAETNNYLTGGKTDWAELTATHYLQGFDISGVNVDQGVDAAKVKQLFTARAGTGIAMACQNTVKSALDGVVTSTKVTKPEGADAILALGDDVAWLDKATSVLAVNGTFLASIKSKFAAINITGTLTELAQYMGFADMVLIPGMVASCAIVPANSMGFIGRVPATIADFKEVGTETDPDTGLSIGIVVASDQGKNRLVANADLWFGCTVQGCAAAASTAGIIKVA